jgi:UDP-N-acetylglucosamine 2-epimerase
MVKQTHRCPYGDGYSSEKICEILKQLDLVWYL